ncbi:hypothetical protein LT493_03245 [Streptomyces tricolor]|nr:hypothetical protein [Streptomyces tricolor]
MSPDLERFSINQMTVRQLPVPDLVDACGRSGVTHVGLWREPVRAYGLEATARLVRDAGLTRHHALPGRLPHGDRPRRTGRGAGRQPRRHRRGRRARHRHLWSWSPAALPRQQGPARCP